MTGCSFEDLIDIGLYHSRKILLYVDCVKKLMCYKKFDPILESKLSHNLVKQIREGLLMSKTELARKAGVSALTI